ncbi:pilus assembly PilX N-terminal domain-containing protein [Halanaerobium congolense]|uniref:pilus assembly PilX N-terminal domain-containing protein n=1 Tax=Halanaerobium congolense TaxID=54121 RepID=UPI00090F36FA|nr:pilus assembly PilX N-terminal domain-containing protein [Halanaerobium congolense]SHM24237.1 hypothetical protein SAMN04515650_101215 [Halanaerobium congolense]
MITIFEKEDGAVLVLSIIIIAVLMTLITALAGSINSNISFTKRQENDVKAFYAAEAGIEKGINMIINQDEFLKDLSVDENQKVDLFKSVKISNDINSEYTLSVFKMSNINYKFISEGENNGIIKKITAIITDPNAGGETLQATGDINLEPEKNGSNDNFITIVDYFNDDAVIEELTTEDFNNYINSFEDQSVLKKYETNVSITHSDYNSFAENYEVLYVDGDLNIESNGNNNHIQVSEDNPFIVIVTGDISFDGIRSISNSSFFVLNDFNYSQPNANVEYENVFIYSGNNVNLAKQSGNGNGNGVGAITISPNFNFLGMIYAQNDITIFSKKGNVTKSEKINVPISFNKIGVNISGEIEITSWEEIN